MSNLRYENFADNSWIAKKTFTIKILLIEKYIKFKEAFYLYKPDQIKRIVIYEYNIYFIAGKSTFEFKKYTIARIRKAITQSM